MMYEPLNNTTIMDLIMMVIILVYSTQQN